jgi:hypothetical protein
MRVKREGKKRFKAQCHMPIRLNENVPPPPPLRRVCTNLSRSMTKKRKRIKVGKDKCYRVAWRGMGMGAWI